MPFLGYYLSTELIRNFDSHFQWKKPSFYSQFKYLFKSYYFPDRTGEAAM